MEVEPAEPRRSAVPLLRLALIGFVVAWLFGPYALRSAVPIWVPFLIALGLEMQFFLGARRSSPPRLERSDRLPQSVDRERYGYAEEAEELLLVRRDGEELWIPYAGEEDEDVEELIAGARVAAEAPRVVAPPASRRRPVRQLLVGLGVIAVLAAVVWLVDSRSGWRGLSAETRATAADRFSREAALIAGHRVTIRCDDAGRYVGAVQHADGIATVGGSLAYLTPQRCFDLYRLAFHHEVSFSQTARAIAVLAHEAWHLHGVSDEGATECYALQSGVELGRRLGLSEGTARRMMRQQLAENSLHGAASSEYVVPAACRDGGALDLHPQDAAFP